jgi:hypothetical protein
VATELKCLVIDASVARASGDAKAVYPTSVHCRDFLQNVRHLQFCVVMTRDIRSEWDKHQSRFARTWLMTMIAKKQLVPLQNLPKNQALWKNLEDFAGTNKERGEMVKDIHLLEAALATDKAIVSLDENTARKYFSQAAQKIDSLSALKVIIWVNPDRIEEEKPIGWLEKGAPYQEARTLGQYKVPNSHELI